MQFANYLSEISAYKTKFEDKPNIMDDFHPTYSSFVLGSLTVSTSGTPFLSPIIEQNWGTGTHYCIFKSVVFL